MIALRKQRMTQAAWLELRASAPTLVSKAELDFLIDRTVDGVRVRCRGKRVAFAWSGGKDSIALQGLCERAGIEACVHVRTHLEYPAFITWADEHLPPGAKIVNTGQDLAWLARHPEMLFPRDSRITSRWFRIVQHAGQNRFAAERKLDMLLFGRRRADGNYVGKGGDDAYSAHGYVKYSPMADWSHAEVLAFAHYYGRSLPPNYGWPRGFRVGTGPWPKRQGTATVADAWSEVSSIDESIVREAATLIPSARDFLAGRDGI